MRKWLARLSFSFIVISAVLVWEGRRAHERGESATWRYALAAVFAVAGAAGIGERHRSDKA